MPARHLDLVAMDMQNPSPSSPTIPSNYLDIYDNVPNQRPTKTNSIMTREDELDLMATSSHATPALNDNKGLTKSQLNGGGDDGRAGYAHPGAMREDGATSYYDRVADDRGNLSHEGLARNHDDRTLHKEDVHKENISKQCYRGDDLSDYLFSGYENPGYKSMDSSNNDEEDEDCELQHRLDVNENQEDISELAAQYVDYGYNEYQFEEDEQQGVYNREPVESGYYYDAEISDNVTSPNNKYSIKEQPLDSRYEESNFEVSASGTDHGDHYFAENLGYGFVESSRYEPIECSRSCDDDDRRLHDVPEEEDEEDVEEEREPLVPPPPPAALTEEDEMSLYQAAMEGEMDAVRTLLQHGETQEVVMLSDETNEKGRTMLHAAVHAHCTDVLEVLLSAGAAAGVDKADAAGETPLHLAVKLGFIDVVTLLVNHGANVNIEDDQGRTPLQLVLTIDRPLSAGDMIVLNVLLPRTDFSIADFDGISALHCLAYWDLWSQLETVLAITHTSMVKDNRGRTPLHYCFMNPNLVALDAAYILVKVDASIMIKDFDGKTPLHRLMGHPLSLQNADVARFMREFICLEVKNEDGHSLLHLSTIGADADMLKFLYRCGTNMDDKDRESLTALHQAVVRNQTDMVRTLLYCGANPNMQDHELQSPLHLAATHGRLSAAKMLLAEGAEVDLRDERGRTALHRCVHAGNVEMAKLLLNRDANPNATDENDSIPLHYAVSSTDKYDIVELLLNKKSKVNYSDCDGRVPLHYAVRSGDSDLIKVLILHGALVNEFDRFGQTPLHIAAEMGKSDVAQTLMNRGANENLRDGEVKKPEQVAADRGSLRVMKVMKEHRDSMIMYSHENLIEQELEEPANPVSAALSRSTNSIVACVSHQALDDVDDIQYVPKPAAAPPQKQLPSNGTATLTKIESDEFEEPGPCGCCRVQ